MHYETQQLKKLWQLIKDKRTTFAGEYLGLIEVSFNLNLEDFSKKHTEKVNISIKDSKTMVLTNIEKVLGLLTSADIRMHHLSCAGDTGLGDNTVLCIHYKDKKRQLYALAIPGINYVPTNETLFMLKQN